ncbi:MAG: hypothetical protein MZV70_61410, partial [Desulfobacterales bacterium]|nr:hypothetical protein [Desulfobacterales bacterium]
MPALKVQEIATAVPGNPTFLPNPSNFLIFYWSQGGFENLTQCLSAGNFGMPPVLICPVYCSYQKYNKQLQIVVSDHQWILT